MSAAVAIRRVSPSETALVDALCALIIDAVHSGASVGFLAPMTRDTAARYWTQVFGALGEGLVLWVAEQDGAVVGSIQLAPCLKENGRHRAEVQKLFVLQAFRGQGVSSRLLATAEEHARALGCSLLVLDTLRGSFAQKVYDHHGWRKAGEIPDFAASPDGKLFPTVYYYKQIGRT
jgi:GNAT superfamily N-acetyltransferase